MKRDTQRSKSVRPLKHKLLRDRRTLRKRTFLSTLKNKKPAKPSQKAQRSILRSAQGSVRVRHMRSRSVCSRIVNVNSVNSVDSVNNNLKQHSQYVQAEINCQHTHHPSSPRDEFYRGFYHGFHQAMKTSTEDVSVHKKFATLPAHFSTTTTHSSSAPPSFQNIKVPQNNKTPHVNIDPDDLDNSDDSDDSEYSFNSDVSTSFLESSPERSIKQPKSRILNLKQDQCKEKSDKTFLGLKQPITITSDHVRRLSISDDPKKTIAKIVDEVVF